MLPLGVLRVAVAIVCVTGIAGMIIGTVATDNNNGVVITFGLISAVAVLVLIASSAVARWAAERQAARAPGSVDEALAERVEQQVSALVSAGATEDEVRALVRDAVRLGRSAR
ncbi:MAG TPA: hypothetical protein VF855_00715 [Acidimicrobiales bacterium]